MRLQTRFVRAKKGMSTIFGALFFIILLLMGFNLMMWSFIQFDNYNHVLASMSQMDTLRIAENVQPQNPGATDFTSNSFNITVDNLGGAVSIARIYIMNLSPTGSTQCQATICTIDPSPASPGFLSGNIAPGEISHRILVKTGGALAPINDGSGYQIILASTRGRQFAFFYPWPVSNPGGNPGGNFLTNIGPLAIYFDFKSFNFTRNTQTQSQSAFCSPSSDAMVFWVKVSNTATDGNVIIKSQTMMQMQPYSANGFGQFVRIWVDDPGTVNPSNVIAYDETNNPYNLPAASPLGNSPTIILKFSATTQNGSGSTSLGRADNWLTFIGIYYSYKGQAQGQTIPFMDFRSVNTYPSGC